MQQSTMTHSKVTQYNTIKHGLINTILLKTVMEHIRMYPPQSTVVGLLQMNESLARIASCAVFAIFIITPSNKSKNNPERNFKKCIWNHHILDAKVFLRGEPWF